MGMPCLSAIANHSRPCDSLKVSILIPVYNAARFLADTLNSAIHQSYQDLEVIVVDDGSTDNSYDIARSFESGILKVFRQENKGAASARNLCFKESTGDYIQYLDADDLLSVDKIQQQLALVSKGGNKYLYSCAWGRFTEDKEESTFDPNPLWKDFEDPVDWLVTAWSGSEWMQPGVWLTHRSLIEAAGPWNESLSLHDDGEFFCRVLLNSEGIKFSSGGKVYHRQVEGSLSRLRSRKAVQSHFDICQLYETHLLARERTPRTLEACADNYAHFYYEYYPDYSDQRKEAIQRAVQLYKKKFQPSGTELFYLLRRMIGWKLARIIERFYYTHGLNRQAVNRKIKKLLHAGKD